MPEQARACSLQAQRSNPETLRWSSSTREYYSTPLLWSPSDYKLEPRNLLRCRSGLSRRPKRSPSWLGTSSILLPQKCARIFLMIRRAFGLAAVVLLATVPGLAWNRAGHMAMGSIAYDRLQSIAPASVVRVTAILKVHPQFESLWRPLLASMSAQEQDRYLFMLAARWPDDIRGNKEFDHPEWHYIDFPYKPPGQPASVPAPQPPADNLMNAFQRNASVLRGTAPDTEQSIALCWIFHLLGDLHQPLHTVSLFSTRFPEGDRGGNLFYVRSDAASPRTQNLHAYWDNILLSDEH